MKWTKKGEEFNEIGSILRDYTGDYGIWGTAMAGEEIFFRLNHQITITTFFDSDESKTEYYGLPVISSEKMDDFSGKIIVASSFYKEIKVILEEKGYEENKDFFFWKTFLGIYFYYVKNKISLNRVDISLTNRCTLRCKYCNMFMPHFEKPQNQALSSVLEDIDTLFSQADYVSTIKLLGGEPFLFTELEGVISHLCDNYRENIGYLEVFTNGTLIPTHSQLTLMAKEGVRVQVTDYTKGVDYSKKLKQVIAKLEEYQIIFSFYSLDKWLDFGFPHNKSKVTEEEALIKKFHLCAPDFRGLVGNRLYFCHLSASAEKAKMYQGTSSDYILLEEGMDKAQLLEFDLGFSETGYVSFCTVCRGCISNIYVDGNTQLERGGKDE